MNVGKKRTKREDPILDFRYYPKEWRIIEKRIKELRKIKSIPKGNEILHKHIYNKMQLLAKDYQECPDCILDSLSDKTKTTIRHHVQPDLHKIFKEISKKSKVPITTIINRLIISPLLIEK